MTSPSASWSPHGRFEGELIIGSSSFLVYEESDDQ